jgi:hypothetical protein
MRLPQTHFARSPRRHRTPEGTGRAPQRQLPDGDASSRGSPYDGRSMQKQDAATVGQLDDQAPEPDQAAPRARSSRPGQVTICVAISWARCASKAFKSGENGATVVMIASLRPRAKRMKSDAMVTVVPLTVTAVSTR